MTGWKAGDMAMCVKRFKWPAQLVRHMRNTKPPRRGQVFIVSKVCTHSFAKSNLKLGEPILALILRDGPANGSGVPIWPARAFIRISPDAQVTQKEVEKKAPSKECV